MKLFVGALIQIIGKQSFGLLLLGKYLMDACIMHIKTDGGLALSKTIFFYSQTTGVFSSYTRKKT